MQDALNQAGGYNYMGEREVGAGGLRGFREEQEGHRRKRRLGLVMETMSATAGGCAGPLEYGDDAHLYL